MNNALTTSGPAYYAIGSDETFRGCPSLNGLPWDLSLGTIVLNLCDPVGNITSIVGAYQQGSVLANWTVVGPAGLWTRSWALVDSSGRVQNSLPLAFAVVDVSVPSDVLWNVASGLTGTFGPTS